MLTSLSCHTHPNHLDGLLHGCGTRGYLCSTVGQAPSREPCTESESLVRLKKTKYRQLSELSH
jgi:hypothetical protein